MYGSPFFLQRVRAAYEAVRSQDYAAMIVLRPDVLLTEPVYMPPPKPTFAVMLSSCIRATCLFANRDFDFGFIASPPEAIEAWLRPPNETMLNGPQPELPEGFNGLWTPVEQPRLVGGKSNLCLPLAKANRAMTAGFENKILELEALGSPLAALDTTSWGSNSFLMLMRDKPPRCIPELSGCVNRDASAADNYQQHEQP